MRRAMAVVTLAVLAGWPAVASAGNLEIRLGAFFPSADSNLFRDDAALYVKAGRPVPVDPRVPGIENSDWVGFTGGIAYNAKIAKNVEIGVNLDGYGRSLDTSYRDSVRDDGTEIRQTLKLDIVPLGVTFRIVPTSRHARIAPFVEAGADVIFYNYEEYGDFIKFSDPTQPIIADAFKSDGAAFGFHVGAGLRVPVSDDFSLVGAYRYQFAKHDMGEDFSGNEIDLSGGAATFGVNLRF
jgi:opacity protein-like surface antigen